VDHLHRFRRRVAHPVLSAAVNDPAFPALEDESGPGVGRETEPPVFLNKNGTRLFNPERRYDAASFLDYLSGGSLGNDEGSSAVRVATEKQGQKGYYLGVGRGTLDRFGPTTRLRQK